MSGDTLGRKVSITIGGNVVASARTKTLTINNSSVNVTADDDSGIQALLDEMGEKSVDLSVDGMYLSTDETLLDLSLSTTPAADVVLDFETFTISGRFFQNSFSNGVPYNEAITFSSSFSSSGAVVKAVAS